MRAGEMGRDRARWGGVLREVQVQEYLEACRAFGVQWSGTAAARAAEIARPGIEVQWHAASKESWESILALTNVGSHGGALARARAASSWWPDDARPQLEAEIVLITSRKNVPELAMAVRTEPVAFVQKDAGKKPKPVKIVKPAAPAENAPEPDVEEPPEEPPEEPERARAPKEGESTPETGVKEIEQPDLSAEELFRRARELAKNSDYDQALACLQRVLNLYPDNVQAQQEWARLAKQVADAKVKLAEQAIAVDDTRGASVLLIEAYELLPESRTVALLKKIGYYLHRAQWLTKEQIETFDTQDAMLAEQHRERLKLGKEYRAVRLDHFRVYTDLPAGAQWDKWLQPHFQSMEALFCRYAWVFLGMLDSQAGQGGLNVVFFKDEQTYQLYQSATGHRFSFRTAGFYDGALHASFFYRDRDQPMRKDVLLHELTHHLNHVALNAASISWINEGLAQYFECGRFEKNGMLTVGHLKVDAFGEIRTRGLKDGAFIPADKLFVAMAPDDQVLAGHTVQAVYAQMWGWVHFFMHCSERHRRAMFACLREDQKSFRGGAWSDPAALYLKTLATQGMPLAKLEQEYKQYMGNVQFTGKKK
jgi:tetratricopeptide (TPR) repeat protein